MTQSTASISNCIRYLTTIALGSLGAVLGTGCIAVGDIVGEAVTQGAAGIGNCIRYLTTIALGRLGAVLGTGCVAIRHIIREAVTQSLDRHCSLVCDYHSTGCIREPLCTTGAGVVSSMACLSTGRLCRDHKGQSVHMAAFITAFRTDIAIAVIMGIFVLSVTAVTAFMPMGFLIPAPFCGVVMTQSIDNHIAAENVGCTIGWNNHLFALPVGGSLAKNLGQGGAIYRNTAGERSTHSIFAQSQGNRGIHIKYITKLAVNTATTNDDCAVIDKQAVRVATDVAATDGHVVVKSIHSVIAADAATADGHGAAVSIHAVRLAADATAADGHRTVISTHTFISVDDAAVDFHGAVRGIHAARITADRAATNFYVTVRGIHAARIAADAAAADGHGAVAGGIHAIIATDGATGNHQSRTKDYNAGIVACDLTVLTGALNGNMGRRSADVQCAPISAGATDLMAVQVKGKHAGVDGQITIAQVNISHKGHHSLVGSGAASHRLNGIIQRGICADDHAVLADRCHHIGGHLAAGTVTGVVLMFLSLVQHHAAGGASDLVIVLVHIGIFLFTNMAVTGFVLCRIGHIAVDVIELFVPAGEGIADAAVRFLVGTACEVRPIAILIYLFDLTIPYDPSNREGLVIPVGVEVQIGGHSGTVLQRIAVPIVPAAPDVHFTGRIGNGKIRNI